MLARWSAPFAVALLTVAVPYPHARAQSAEIGTGTPPPAALAKGLPPGLADMGTELARMQYNPERGPLIAVVWKPLFRTLRPLPPSDAPGATPQMIADAFDHRIFKAGEVMVIAARQMSVINARPGKPNVLRDLPTDVRLKALFGTLSAAQWQRIGADGLAPGDLTDDQRALMDGIWPRDMLLQKSKVVVPEDQPRSRRYENEGEATPLDGDQVRLRLSRVAYYEFTRLGEDETAFGSGTDPVLRDGTFVYNAVGGHSASDDRTSAFGKKIIEQVPNRLKPGELDFAAPALDAPVPLQKEDDTAFATVGELLKQVSATTGLDIRADARAAREPLYVRAAPGQTARAGDVLMALALSVTGAYRRLSPRLFLLTDDVEGIGARFARLNEWAAAAEGERYNVLKRVTADVSKHKPLQYLSYRAGYHALPRDIAKKVEDELTRTQYSPGVPFKMSDLPPSVRKDVEAAWEAYEFPGSTFLIDHSKVTINMALKVQWVLPDGNVLDGRRSGLDHLHFQFINELIPRPKADPAGPPPPYRKTDKSPVFPSAVRRRVVAVAPRTPGEARQMIRAATARGFNEVWVRHPLNPSDSTAPATLKAAVAAGKTAGVPVVALAPLLHQSGVGVPEQTILGQTGSQWAASYVGHSPYLRSPDDKRNAIRESNRYKDWTYPVSDKDEAALVSRLLAVAATPGLAGLCLTHTTPPGYAISAGGDGLLPGSHFGYTLEGRMRFLDRYGYDPIDVVTETHPLQVETSLPFFPNYPAQYRQVNGNWVPDETTQPPYPLWQEFRKEQTRARLGQVYERLRAAQPKLPLYLQDRVSEYTAPHTPWFGSWDSAIRLPGNQVYLNDRDGDGLARAAADVRLYRIRWDFGANTATDEDWFVSSVRRGVTRVKKTPKTWHGVVVDLSALPAPDVLQLLEVLPPSEDTPRPARAR